MAKRESVGWEDYEIRTGKDGKPGIYLRDYNVRLATFNCNTHALQVKLDLLFNRAARIRRAKVNG